MKKLLIIIALFVFLKDAFSKATFTIDPNYPFSEGKIALNVRNSTTIHFVSSVNRGYDSNTQNYENVNATVQFIYRTPSEDKVIFTKISAIVTLTIRFL